MCRSADGAQASKPARKTITGTVTDALGRPLAGAGLELQNSAGRIVAKAKSDAEGRFTFAVVAPAVYAIVASKATFKTATAIVSVTGQGAKPLTLALQSEAALSMAVVAQRLNKARNSLSPETGGSVYRFSEKAIQELPQGNNTPLNQVLLQAPGVVQDSFGQLHVRGDHANLQYRINGVQLPEGITGFGQVISPRFAQSISLLTGALPAEFGLRTAGIIDIKTKDGLLENGGDVEFYGGQRATIQPSFEYGGSVGKFSYFVTGQYFSTDRGVEPPTPGPSPIHDQSYQGAGFGYFSYFLNPTTRLSLITGLGRESFSDSGESRSAAGLRALGRAGLSVGGSRREPVRAELFRGARSSGDDRLQLRLSDRAVQPLFDGFVLSGFRRRPDLQRRRFESLP